MSVFSGGTIAGNVLPDATGRNLGALAQLWNAFIQICTFGGATSGSTQLKAAAIASGVLTLPAATDTLVGKATTDALTNKTLISPVLTTPNLGVATATSIAIGGGTALASSNQTGTGSLVLATSPALTTPTIGGGSSINKIVLASGTLTFTSIASQVAQEQTLTVTGAAITGVAFASPTTNLGNISLTWCAWVSGGGNQINVRVSNPTTGAITPNAVTWNAMVIQ